MPSTNAEALRTTWCNFFEARGHTVHPSASLVPESDPTLLFTGAGMNQFKAMFLGKGDLPFTRAVTIQKCFRQGDLDNVGTTPRHLTFFEMLGHFSFGDYFKEEAIPWAWTFLTKELSLSPARLRVSVYEEDDVAYEAWLKTGVSRDAMRRFDAAENYWPANAPRKGPNGPCGPCTEIFFDYGKAAEVGDESKSQYDSGRFVEIWNTVFTQFDRRGVDDLAPLPQQNIDCGAGFERIVAAIEGEQSPFGSTLFRPLIEHVAEMAGKRYAFDPTGMQTPGQDPARMRRIAEHARAACALIADGVKPSNEGRGYVLRRILRRAIRDGIQLGLNEPFLADMVDPVLSVMGTAYPTWQEGADVLRSTLSGEDQRFRETYATGLRYLENEVRALGSGKILSGEAAFRLYDTYGFPLDLAEAILVERGLSVDHEAFHTAMKAQRERARAGSKIAGDIFAGGPLTELKANGVKTTTFLGHDHPGIEANAIVVGIVDDGGALLGSADRPEDEIVLVLDQTTFYAESGGQVGDQGVISNDAASFEVHDTTIAEGYVLHRGSLRNGSLRVGDAVHARVASAVRDATRRNHTATHLLHAALHRVLGDHVRQEGSLVASDRLRFDFHHDKAMTEQEIERVEDLVNRWIVANDPVQTDVMDLDAAKKSGAMALFGEKYENKVRVVHVASGSRELCGGTHCVRTGDIGTFHVTTETNIAAGVRRIEAVTGLGAAEAAQRARGVVHALSVLLKAKPNELVDRVKSLRSEVKALRREAERARLEAGKQAAAGLASSAESVGGARVLVAEIPGADGKALKGVWDTLRKNGVEVALIAGDSGGKVPLLAAVAEPWVGRGLSSKELLAAATGVLGGGGGGRPQMAQGMGQDRSKLADAFVAARDYVGGALTDA